MKNDLPKEECHPEAVEAGKKSSSVLIKEAHGRAIIVGLPK
jgi:hypothetical protein